uniref:signal recognition particle receptor subunit beta isoform X2 n=1 Tax=Myxine glutinosa TaxID=7769 RepID=UPI00358F050C
MEDQSMERSGKQYVSTSQQEFPGVKLTCLGVITALIVVLLTVWIFRRFSRKLGKGQTVLLAGLTGSGKTALFIKLLTGKYQPTQTSIVANKSTLPLNGNKRRVLQLFDCPGSENIRQTHMDSVKSSLRAVVVVINSAELLAEVRDTAALIYSLLADAETSSVPFLFICNKQDLSTAKVASIVRQQLEKEISTLRRTLPSALSLPESEQARKPTYLDQTNSPFTFQCLPSPPSFIETSTVAGTGIADVFNWLSHL